MVLSAKIKKNDIIVDMPLPTKGVKKKRVKFKLSGPSVILLILLGFIFYSFGGQVVEMYKVQHEIKKIQNQMDDLQEKNSDLRRQIEQLSSEAYIEREAREKLGLVKPGEKIIIEAVPGAKGSKIPKASQNPGEIEVH